MIINSSNVIFNPSVNISHRAENLSAAIGCFEQTLQAKNQIDLDSAMKSGEAEFSRVFGSFILVAAGYDELAICYETEQEKDIFYQTIISNSDSKKARSELRADLRRQSKYY